VHCLVENKHVSNNAARSLKVALALVTGFENTWKKVVVCELTATVNSASPTKNEPSFTL